MFATIEQVADRSAVGARKCFGRGGDLVSFFFGQKLPRAARSLKSDQAFVADEERAFAELDIVLLLGIFHDFGPEIGMIVSVDFHRRHLAARGKFPANDIILRVHFLVAALRVEAFDCESLCLT